LADVACRFFTFWATIAALEICADAAFRCIGAIMRTSIWTNLATYCYVYLTLAASNKPLLLCQIPIWWRWSMWVMPMWYAMTGIANNEFLVSSYADRGAMARELAPDGVGVASTSRPQERRH
jgi:hypothetical protein